MLSRSIKRYRVAIASLQLISLNAKVLAFSVNIKNLKFSNINQVLILAMFHEWLFEIVMSIVEIM